MMKEMTSLSFLHAICSTPDIRSLYLRGTDSWVEEKVERIQHSLLLDVPSASSDEYEWFLSDLKTAFLLEDWIDEKPYDALVLKYNIWPGDVHTIVEMAEWLLHATREFARMYNFSCVSDVNNILIRVQNGCKEELLNLVSLKGIGRVRARALYREGFKTVNDLRNVPVERLAKIKAIGTAVAKNIKQQIGESGVQRKQTTARVSSMITVLGTHGTIKNIDMFVQQLLAFSKKEHLVIQAFDATVIYGKDHLISATTHAKRAFQQGTNATNSPALEILLYAAGERQIQKAIKKIGVKKGEQQIVFVVTDFLDQKTNRYVGKTVIQRLLKTFQLTIDEKVLKGDRTTLKRFGITDQELSTIPEEKYGDRDP